MLSDDHPQGSQARRAQALCMLETYLETDTAPGPVFSLPRSPLVDQLLCRWAFEKAEVDEALLEALDAVPLISTPAEVAELSKGWAASAASLVHAVSGLQARLNAYLHVLLAAGRTTDDDRRTSDEAVDVEGEEVPLYVVLEPGTRTRASGAGPRSLHDLVRKMKPKEQGSSLGLGVAGDMLSGGPPDAQDDDDGA